jgi:hypothetical protein
MAPAGDVQHVAADVGGALRNQEGHRIGHAFELADARHRRVLLGVFAHLGVVRQIAYRLRIDNAGGNGSRLRYRTSFADTSAARSASFSNTSKCRSR